MGEKGFQQTGLWQRAFPDQGTNDYADQRIQLKSEFLKFRTNVEILVSKIASLLPGLTVHDITHLDALWETADIIAGENYKLNPLETFILGGSFLLHDSAMCWEAYENGEVGVRATTEWKDAYAVEQDKEPEAANSDLLASADFSALRSLHAHQASILINKSWLHPETLAPIFLINDHSLRTHMGRIIGNIASSHHWNIDVLLTKLGDQLNAPSPFPSEWQIDPIKIACLLRCADAAHINQQRTPDFLYALIKRKGLSLLHWQAQNRMTGPALDRSDSTKSTIVYTSTYSFKESDADAWWIAYDSISLIEAEIKASNLLLKNRNAEFAIKRIKGANSIEDISKYLRVDGWKPCNAELHISNIESLVRELGGEKLYGSSNIVEVVLRELLQNARDAVVSRRYVEDEQDFEGEISIKIQTIDDESWLYIEDNGIGMSYEVLTGSLLDFGTSFWKSSLVQTEFPGLRSSKFRSIGRFGIGFYSIFMIANRVEVISKRWDKGLDDVNSLMFKNGLALRPILKLGRVNGFSNKLSTQIRIQLKPNLIKQKVKITLAISDIPDLYPTFSEFVARMVAGLDVKVTYEGFGESKKEIHTGHRWDNSTKKALLKKLSFGATQQHDPFVNWYIERNHHRLREIIHEGRVVGVAALSTHYETGRKFLGARTVGGLISSNKEESFIGYIDCEPVSAKRDSGKYCAPSNVIEEWAKNQLIILENEKLEDFERYFVSTYACAFDVDPISIARICIVLNKGQAVFVSYDELAEIAMTHKVGIFKSIMLRDHAETNHSVEGVANITLIKPLINGKSLSLEQDENGVPSNPNSIIGCLHRAAVARGLNPVWSISPEKYQAHYGEMELLMLSY